MTEWMTIVVMVFIPLCYNSLKFKLITDVRVWDRILFWEWEFVDLFVPV